MGPRRKQARQDSWGGCISPPVVQEKATCRLHPASTGCTPLPSRMAQWSLPGMRRKALAEYPIIAKRSQHHIKRACREGAFSTPPTCPPHNLPHPVCRQTQLKP